MSTLSAYLQTWRLKLSHTKTVTAAFHLNNREAKRELKVYNNGRLSPFCPTPTYLGVKLDRSLTFRHHLVALRKKLPVLHPRPTPTYHLLVLSGIQPAELRRMGATFSLAHRGSLDLDHILYDLLSGSSDTRHVRLRSRRPFVPTAQNHLDNLARLGIRASEWTNHKWNTEYYENASRLRAFVPETGARPVGMGLPRATCVKLNRLRTGVGRFHSSMHK